MWQRANFFAGLAIIKNSKPYIQSRIRAKVTARQTYNKLKKAFKEKMVIEFWVLYASILNHYFNNRKTTIREYISAYEKSGNIFLGIIKRVDLTTSAKVHQILRPLYDYNVQKLKTEIYLFIYI